MSLLLLLRLLLLLPRRRHSISLVVGHVALFACHRWVCQPAEWVVVLLRVRVH
jgi:hypothetical protein